MDETTSVLGGNCNADTVVCSRVVCSNSAQIGPDAEFDY